MYLLIDIGNTRIKWQHRDAKNTLLTGDILVENFMDIDFSQIESLKKILVSNVNHKIVLEKIKKSIARFKCPLIEVDTCNINPQREHKMMITEEICNIELERIPHFK